MNFAPRSFCQLERLVRPKLQLVHLTKNILQNYAITLSTLIFLTRRCVPLIPLMRLFDSRLHTTLNTNKFFNNHDPSLNHKKHTPHVRPNGLLLSCSNDNYQHAPNETSSH